MTEEPAGSRRNQDLKPTGDRNLSDPGDALVRVLVNLTDDVERFDSMLLLQRRIIEDRARREGDAAGDEAVREAAAIGAEAAGLVGRARAALDELRRLGEETGLPARDAAVRSARDFDRCGARRGRYRPLQVTGRGDV